MAKLNKEQTDKLLSYLKEKWKGKSCPMCQIGNWMVQDGCFQISEYNASNFLLSGIVIPIIPVTCDNCSNIILINALQSGVIEPNDTNKD